jgi:hypothetical protein
MPVILGTSKQYSGFSPQSIPGLSLWLDGADSTTITGTTNVTAWKDKSSNGYTFSGSGAAATNPGLNFNGSAYLTNGSITAISAPYTVLAVGSSTSQPNTFQRMISGGVKTGDPYDAILAVGTSNTTPFVWFGYSGNWLANPYLTGSSYSGTNVLLTGGTVTSGTSPTLVGYVNGSQLSSVTGAAYQATSITGINIGGGYSSATAGLQPWYGNINEVLIYNGVLTTSQRQQVEGYLAQKWGLGTSFVGGVTKPTQIPGCVVWLDAADSSTITSSSSLVSQWVDKASGLPLLQATSSAQPVLTTLAALNNLPVLNLYSGSTLRNMRSTATTTFTGPQTAFMVFYLTNGGNLLTEIGAYPAQYRYLYTGNSTLSEYAPATGPHRTFQQGTNASVIYTAGTAYVTMILDSNATANISDAALRLNGVNSSTLNFYSSQSAVIGGMTDNFAVIGYGTAASYLGEIIYYNRALSSTEYQAVEGYLATKWGLRGSLPSTHPYYTGSAAHPFALYAPVTRPFQPSDIAGCQLWLDGADASTVTVSASSVTQWKDKSTNGLVLLAGQTGSQTGTTYTNNRVGVHGTYLMTTGIANPLDLTNYTSFIVSVPNGTPNHSPGVSASPLASGTTNSSAGSYQGFGTYYEGNSSSSEYRVYGYYQSAYTYNVSAYIDLTKLSIITDTQTSAGVNSVYYNSTFVANASLGGPRSSGVTAFAVGTSTTGGTSPVSGSEYSRSATDFAEIIVYNSVLSNSQIQQVEGYLAAKWGLNASLPTTQPFYKFPPLSTSLLAPTQISGCALWLDAADSSTITFSSGINVSQWSDKSGNGINATVLNGTPTYTQSLGMTFNGSSALQVPYTASPTIESLFVVIKFNSVAAQGDIFSGTATGQREYIMYSPYSPGTIYLGRYGTAPSGSVNGGTVTTSTNYMLGYVFNGTANTISFYQQGNTITSGTPQFTYSAGGTISAIGSYNGNGYLRGQIYELLIYNVALTTSQRQAVEGYLAQKWGLTSSLPSTHPYVKIPPAMPQ